MANTSIRVPKLGMDTTEAVLAKWLVSEGDRIRKGTPLAQLESEKVSFDYESEIEGRLVRILVAEGETVPVGDVIALAEID
jgi:pyruvate/2-oxoglutarate dehydrogenase complex dihydrolipoamide acyltransferase (E2) component